MYRRRLIPLWLFWPFAVIITFLWVYLITWLLLHFFGGTGIGQDPLRAIPNLLQSSR